MSESQPAYNVPGEHQELWSKLCALQFDKPGAPYPFSKRLAKRNEWTHEFALKVIEEYRKFLYLLGAAGHMVTPSIHVDEAWHLHLIYTHSYWEVLCRDIFKRPIHHHPGDGSAEDDVKYKAIYERTLCDYMAVFGTPPEDIWGRPNKGIDWRAILGKLPVPGALRSSLMELFPRPSDEAP